MVIGNRALTYEQVKWAHEKWCNGYTLEEIGEALNCSLKTVRRSFDYYGFKRCKKAGRRRLEYGCKGTN